MAATSSRAAWPLLVALFYSMMMLLFCTFTGYFMFPMNLHGSVADLAIVSAALAVLSLLYARPGGAAAAAAATTSLVKQVESGEAAEQIVCGAAFVVVVLAATKAAMLDWPSLGTGGTRQVSALTLVLDALLFSLAAFYIRREQQERRRYMLLAEEAALGGFGKGDKEYKLLEEAAGGGRGGGRGAHGAMLDDDDPDAKRLSILQVLKTLKPYFWPRQTKGRVHVIMTWVFVCGSKATSVVAPLFIAKATNELSSGEIEAAMYSAGWYGLLLLCSKVLKEFQSLVYLGVAQAAFTDLSQDTFEHVHTLSLHWHLGKKLGEVVRVIDRGISACDTLMKYGVLYLVPAMGECITVVVLFFTVFDVWSVGVLVFSCLAAYAVLTYKLTMWRKRFRASMNKKDNRWHDRITDSLVNFETVKYFTNERYERDQFAEAVAGYQKDNVAVQASLSLLNISQQVILNACLAFALVLSAGAYHQGKMNVGDFVAVNVWVVQLFTPLNFLGTVYNAIVTAWVDLLNLSQLLGQTPDILDEPGAVDLLTSGPSLAHRSSSSNASRSLSGGGRGVSVAFDAVDFRYPTGSGRGLRDVSFLVKPGTTTAVVGTTGAGKTTIGRLLFRFFDPLGGRVLVDGMDVRRTTQHSLRSVVGVVPQDTVLFNDTIRHNVSYGRLGSSLAALEEAARGAQILDFINGLPDGWDTVVGERGLKLSGGEKQRVAIARALLKDPPVVLLDEATSALDSVTERSVQEALNALGKNRTVLVIAHRLGTVQHADEIVVLSDGQIVEKGTHKELWHKGGAYAKMWETQARAAAAEVEAAEGLQEGGGGDDQQPQQQQQAKKKG